MNFSAERIKRQRWPGAAWLGLALLLIGASLGTALAHGKDVTIQVSSWTPDPQQPLTRLYRAWVVYSDDKEPVSGAVILLTARRRPGGEALPPVRLEPLNAPGFYAAQVTLPRYGTWEILLEVKEPGPGSITFQDEVLPAPLPRETASGEGESQGNVFGLSLGFNERDVINLGVRWLHSLAAVAWFGMSGLIVAAFGFFRGGQRNQFLRRLYPWFPPLAGVSLALLAGSGVYNAIYNSPIRPPGVFDLQIMGRIPYGIAYLVAVSLKVLAVLAGVGLAVAMARGLKRIAALLQGGNPGATGPAANAVSGKGWPLLPSAAANLVLGLAMLLSVAVMAYLHNLSHLALLVP